MTTRRQEEHRLHGVFGEPSPGAWVLNELASERTRREMDAEEGTRPVSVRLDGDTIALLDAFAERFSLSRSSMLNRLIHGGLAEAFRYLPGDEQQRLWDNVRMSGPYGAMSFSELFAAAKASGEIEEIPKPTQPSTANTAQSGASTLPGIFGALAPEAWVREQLKWESVAGSHPGADDDRVPVSVRLTADAIALLDAFAVRFSLSRSGLLMRLIRGGLAQSYRALPDAEQTRMLSAVRVRVPNFAKSFADLSDEAKGSSGRSKRKRRGTRRDVDA
jgi:hypothetical protein